MTAIRLSALACLVFLGATLAVAGEKAAAGDPAVADALKLIRQKHDVPAMIGAVVTSRGIESCGVVGVRKSGSTIPATLDDLWHLGSDTKAMTAALAGRLVEQGLLKWNTTVADVFPNMAPTFHPEAKGITLSQLLSHRAGLPANLEWDSFAKKGSIHGQRLEVVRQGLAEKPATTPGSQFLYSNLGYTIAGAMIEKAAGTSWEKAMEDELFKPLGMKSAGFGGVGTPGRIDQPWGHTASGQPVAENGPSVDNPPVMAPAGRVHCTIQDWAKFVADQVRGARGEPALLKKATYQTLHTPPFGGSYALGWGLYERNWGGGTVLTHAGCNTMNYAVAWIAPKKDLAILVCANQGDDAASKACDEAVMALVKLHVAKEGKKRP